MNSELGQVALDLSWLLLFLLLLLLLLFLLLLLNQIQTCYSRFVFAVFTFGLCH